VSKKNQSDTEKRRVRQKYFNFISMGLYDFICTFNIKLKLYPASTMVDQTGTKEETSDGAHGE